VIAAGAVAERAIQRGVSSDRIVWSGGFVVPEDLFKPVWSKNWNGRRTFSPWSVASLPGA